ncbi:MAG: SUF system Fe-S cluster assembly regulator [Kordiimonadaceae bacterium]|nr:SUF system Fe-S cluster assembly regulator [Kordiimonadaceae bacterium]
MLKLTKLADYAVILMCEMVRVDQRVCANVLAEGTGVPTPTVSKILNMLSRGQLLQSHRGLKGGFSLTRDASEISVSEIVEIMDGPIALTICTDGGICECEASGCGLRPRWQIINKAVKGALDDVKLSTLAAPVFPGLVVPMGDLQETPRRARQ